MDVRFQHYEVEAVVALTPEDVKKAVEQSVAKLGRFKGREIVVLQALPHVAVEVRKSTNKHESKH